MREVLRRTFNFFVGPRPDIQITKGQWQFALIPWVKLLHWYSSPGYHFEKLGIIEIGVWDRMLGLYWVDSN